MIYHTGRAIHLLIKGKMTSKQTGLIKAALKSAKSAPYSVVGTLKYVASEW